MVNKTDFLLDTNVLIWWLGDDKRLSSKVKEIIQDDQLRIYVSTINVWEMAIKKAVGKLKSPDNILELIAKNEFIPLDVTMAHGVAVGALPLIHHDPFDRLLIAQAQVENMTIITADKQFRNYDIKIFEA